MQAKARRLRLRKRPTREYARIFLAGKVINAVRNTGKEHCLACSYPRTGLDESINKCPECGERFGFESCLRCHQSMRGVADARYCPECGADQQLPPPRPDFTWLICQYVDERLPLSAAQLAQARRGRPRSGGENLVLQVGQRRFFITDSVT